MKPDLQYFEADGTWVKPPGAVRSDIVLQGGGGGAAFCGRLARMPGKDGQITVRSLAAGDLPDLVSVEIGAGGRPGGQAGYALVITHVRTGGGHGH